ncbi:hypothetical protein NW754_001344 [Fusarium falciforme]|nr:hypothetical protein NW754_001344 [Fusarium falciforme]
MSVLSDDINAKWLFGSVLPYAEPAWARGYPSPYYNDSHRRLRAAMRSWVDENLMPHTLEWETSQVLPDWLWEKAAKDGVIMPMAAGAAIPQEWAGKYPIMGNIAPEEWDGFHDLTIHDEFERVGGVGIHNGLVGCTWITGGMYAQYFVTLVKESTGDFTVLVIPRTQGVTTRHITLSGSTVAGTAFVDFESVQVPMDMVVGVRGQGLKYIMSNFNHERLFVGFQALRCARVCLEDSIRETFGKKLVDHSVIRFKISNMSRETEALQTWIESLIYQLPQLSSEESVFLMAGITAQLKAHSGIVLESVAREAIQIMGGVGLTRGGRGERVERIWRDVKAITIPGGSEEILLDLGTRWALKINKQLRAAASEAGKSRL